MLPNDVREIAAGLAAAHNLPQAHLMAIVDVESGGRVFADVPGLGHAPLILFEPHLMFRMTTGAVRDQLVAEGLAAAKPNRKLYGKTQAERWAQLKRAATLAGDVAYEATSYGVGQVLGQHWKALGFETLQAFISLMFSGAEGQIDIMLRYIETNDLDDELREGRWPAFFRGYNGPAWDKNGYGVKVETALRSYGGAYVEADGMLRLGAKGARVRELQALLVRAGQKVNVDGDFGPATKAALRGFQGAHGLTVDGVYGPETERALGAFRQSAADKPGAQGPLDVKDVLKGAGTAIGGPVVLDKAKDALDGATTQLQQVQGFDQIIQPILGGLAVLAVLVAIGGVGWMIWGWWKSRQTVET